MISPFLVLWLLAAPKAPPNAEVMTYLPRLDSMGQLTPFFTAAGSRAVLLRPESWRSEAHPLIDLDVFSPQAVALAGVDPAGSLTHSQVGDVTIVCLSVSDVGAYRKAADEKLARLGQLFEKVEAGVPVYASRDSLGRVQAAYALKGKESCAVSGRGRSVEPQFPLLAQAILKPAAGPAVALMAKLPGVLRLVGPVGPGQGALSLTAKGLQLTVDAKSKGAALSELAGPGPSPFAAFSPPGMAVIRSRMASSQLGPLVEAVVRRFPNAQLLLPVAREVSPRLTGNVALLVSHAKVTTGLRTPEARFFALRAALLVEVKDVAAVAAVLEQLDPKSLGALTVSLEGSVLVVANDAEVRARALGALAHSAGKQAHALEFEIDPKLVAKGLQQIPLLEAVQSSELVGLVAAGSELGPVLLASEKMSGFVESAPGGQHLGRFSWKLDETKFTTAADHPDAGP